MTRKEGHTGIINIRLKEKKKKKRRRKKEGRRKEKKRNRIAGLLLLLLVYKLTWGVRAPESHPGGHLAAGGTSGWHRSLGPPRIARGGAGCGGRLGEGVPAPPGRRRQGRVKEAPRGARRPRRLVSFSVPCAKTNQPLLVWV